MSTTYAKPSTRLPTMGGPLLPTEDDCNTDYRSLNLAAQHRIHKALERKSPVATGTSRDGINCGGNKRVSRRQRRSKTLAMAVDGTVPDDDNDDGDTAGTSAAEPEFSFYEPDMKVDDTIFDDVEDEANAAPKKQLIYDFNQKNYLSACRALRIPPAKSLLNALPTAQIVMRNHLLGNKGVRACALSLLDNGTVETMDLEGNDIGPAGCRYLCEMMEENIFITDLSLAENHVGSEGLRCITNLLRDNDVLLQLNVSGNAFEECDAAPVADIISHNRTLRELRLSHNMFGEQGGIVIGQALARNKTIEVLDLSWNHLRRKGAIAIADGILNNRGVRKLDVSWNGFHLEGCKALARALESNNTLEELDLSCNRINAVCLEHLLRGLRRNRTLTVLKLAQNPISTAGATSILEVLEKHPDCAVKEIDVQGQDVDTDFLLVLNRLRSVHGRHLVVRYGLTLKQEGLWNLQQDDVLFTEDPLTILMEFMRLNNFRVLELFTVPDKDHSWTLSREALKEGLLKANIPLTEKTLDHLISKLDTDKSGELDFAELIEGQKRHKMKMRKMIEDSKTRNIPMEDTELGRVTEKLKLLMRAKQQMFRATKKGGAVSTKSGLKSVADRAERSPTTAARLKSPERPGSSSKSQSPAQPAAQRPDADVSLVKPTSYRAATAGAIGQSDRSTGPESRPGSATKSSNNAGQQAEDKLATTNRAATASSLLRSKPSVRNTGLEI